MLAIRPYKDTDWKRLCDIHDSARIDELRGSVDLGAFLDLETTAEGEGLFDGELWVAEEADKVLGFVAFVPDEITWLYIDPKHYRKGIGKALLEFAIQGCGATITVEVLSGNTPAIELYHQLGFEIIEKRKGQLTGNETFDAEGYIMKLEKSE